MPKYTANQLAQRAAKVAAFNSGAHHLCEEVGEAVEAAFIELATKHGGAHFYKNDDPQMATLEFDDEHNELEIFVQPHEGRIDLYMRPDGLLIASVSTLGGYIDHSYQFSLGPMPVKPDMHWYDGSPINEMLLELDESVEV